MQDEVRASVGYQDVSSDFGHSDLDDVQFYYENPDTEMAVVYRSRIDTAISSSLFESFSFAGEADYPVEIEDTQEKEKETSTPQQPSRRDPRNRHC